MGGCDFKTKLWRIVKLESGSKETKRIFIWANAGLTPLIFQVKQNAE